MNEILFYPLVGLVAVAFFHISREWISDYYYKENYANSSSLTLIGFLIGAGMIPFSLALLLWSLYFTVRICFGIFF